MNLSAAAGPVTAPPAPGRMGAEVQPDQARVYLEHLGQWRDGRRAELDQLDQAALQSPNGAAATSDITLSMALWKAASDRYEQLQSAWDAGRMGPTERLRLATLIWGRLDTEAASGLAVSLPEACRLSDALASSLRVRLGLEVSVPRSPSGSDSCGRRWSGSGTRSPWSRPAPRSSRPPDSRRGWPGD